MIQTPLRRGIMIPWFKKEANAHKIEDLRKKGTTYLPVPPYVPEEALEVLGAPRKVAAGETLWKDKEIGMPFYATVNGEVDGIRMLETAQGDALCLAIKNDGQVWTPPPTAPRRNPKTVDVIEAARKAAIVDEQDGRPLWEKLKELKEHPCDVLVADGVEPEPFACSAHAVLKTYGTEVLAGAAFAAEATGVPRYLVAVQLKRKQHKALKRKLKKEFLYGVPNCYPVPRYTRQLHTSVCRIGVQACLALYQAVLFDQPATTCVVTVAGDAISHSRNVRVPYGTTFTTLLSHTGLEEEPQFVIAGDALTGTAVSHDRVPVVPGITCVLGLVERSSPTPRSCIGCGRCVQACHVGILPYEIARRLENAHYDRLAVLEPHRCDGCGNCGYVCPVGKDLTAEVLEAKATSAPIVMKWRGSDDV